MSTETSGIKDLRGWWEFAAWIALVAVLWGTDLFAKYLAAEQAGIDQDFFRLVSEQATSAVAVLIMIPFLVYWTRLLPPSLEAWPRLVIGHTSGSIIFAFGHFALMVAMRVPWYALNGRDFLWRESFVNNLFVEYQKDIKIYIGFVVLIYAYRFYRSTRSPDPQPHTDRLIVQTGSGSSVLKHEDIDYLEAARNYVSVYANGREYVTRDTMSNLEQRLSAGPFERTHRSFIVNIDKIGEIRNVDSGQRIFLTSGAEIPLSRGYRDAFEKNIGG